MGGRQSRLGTEQEAAAAGASTVSFRVTEELSNQLAASGKQDAQEHKYVASQLYI
jgi:hypothetical protein